MLAGIHFPDLALHHLARGVSDSTRPMALIDGHPLMIRQCNEAAGSAGVVPGQRLATATALCDSLLCYPMPDETPMLESMAQWAYGLSGQVMLFPPHTLVLEVRSMLRLFGGLPAWIAALEQGLAALQLPARWALSETPLAAALLAQAGQHEPKPRPVREALEPLPLSAWALPGEAEPRLAGMGVRDGKALLALPRAELGQRFGAELLLYLERLLGERPDPRSHFVPPEHYQRRLEMMEEIETVAVLRFPLNRLFLELAEVLRRRQLAATHLQLSLRHRHRPATELILRPAGPEHRAEVWMTLCQLQLERLVLYEPVMALELSAPTLLPLELEGGTLLAGSRPDRAARDLLAQLQARLGTERIYSLQTVAEGRPELAQRRCLPGQGKGQDDLPERPPWLLPEPVPVARAGLTLVSGPERIETGWWDEHPVARDYFVAEDGAGRRMWLFRDGRGWFVHGWF